ncbi:uncharacterized protein LOC129594366 isoform X2 [Paramacrobiotus metropolitanus]|uniref:uncharacterized protein LOC129594366 isoform X2 n=1 Tax=Paramacrobiotus metropolitanus TaxID=2943436 RepID=UPI002445F237|nr:uncharacterized protein LOC129594366 isoform X2 [Paramacrobiotus metropolitanus]
MEHAFWTVTLVIWFSMSVPIQCKSCYCIIFIILLHKRLYSQFSTACPVSVSTEGDLDRLIRKAEEQTQNGVIVLPVFQWHTSQTSEIENVVRIPTGMTATFACPTNMAADTAKTIVWRHQNRTIAANNDETASTSTFFYNRKDRAEFSYFFIHNVTYSALGSVQCLHRYNRSDDLFLIKRFELRPKLQSVEEVFPEVMLNVTSTQSKNVSVSCTANVDCRCTKGPYFLIKYDRIFAVKPRDLSPGTLRPSRLLSYPPDVSHYKWFYNCRTMIERDTIPCTATLFVFLSKHSQHRSVPVECWAQPDVNSNVWFVQKAYVNFV